MAWGEPGDYVTKEVAAAVANSLDHQNKKTRLNNKKSIGKAMQQLKLGDEDDTIALNEKVPLNVLCARSWQEGALTNIVEYSMGTKGRGIGNVRSMQQLIKVPRDIGQVRLLNCTGMQIVHG